MILRTAWVYAAVGKNFLLTMLRLMREHGAVRVVNDQHGTPPTAASIARAIWAIAQRPDIHGIVHWTDAGTASWYDFAVAIAEEGTQLLACCQVRWPQSPESRTAEYPTPARRPANSALGHPRRVDRADRTDAGALARQSARDAAGDCRGA